MHRCRVYRFMWLLPLLVGTPRAWAEGPFVGIELGGSQPTNGNFRAHAHGGGSANPYGGYMFNDYLGLQGQLHFTFLDPDNDHRGIARENQTVTVFGGAVGPRLALPIGRVIELYGTGEGGYFTGLSGRLTQSAPGFSVGGGLDLNLSDSFTMGVFGRWTRVYMSPRPTDLGPTQVAGERFGEDIQWVTGGLDLKYSFRPRPAAPVAPPPPPVVAQAPPPPPPTKRKIILRSVRFDFDKAIIRADAVPVLDEAVTILKEENVVAVIVEGHTDSVGSDEYNMKLSHRRANAVRDYLTGHGIPASRIRTEGYGESRPVASNDTDDGRAQNRRVELRVE